MQPSEIAAVIAAKRKVHPELRRPLHWIGLQRVLARENVLLAVVPLARPAKLVPYEGMWMLLVNSRLPARRHTYYAAHELGHLWLHRHADDELEARCYHMDLNWPDDPREDEAELFAQLVLGACCFPTADERANAMDFRDGAHPWNEARLRDRAITELLGFAKGIIADGCVSDAEAVGLLQWVDANPQVIAGWPGNVLFDRLQRIFEDGVVDDEEREELRQLLTDLVGEDQARADAMVHPTRLPLTTPPPTILFDDRLFVFTGTFLFGTRKKCEAAVIDRGGKCASSPNRATHYVVIGTHATEAWQFSTHGRKIEEAIALRDAGVQLAIVAEQTWVDALESCSRRQG